MPAVAVGPGPMYRGLRVFEINELDQHPVAQFQARPQYPFEMRRNGVAGEVVVEFIIDTEGNVVNARAIRSSHEAFEAAAVAAVSKWKFRPGRKGARDVPTHMQVPIVFTLNQE
jgi:protein TonB